MLHYGWWILALILIAVEVIQSGYFMLWIGIAAGLTGAVMLIAPGLPMLAQACLFVALSFLSCAAYWYGLRPRLIRGDAPDEHLNRRGEQLVGGRYILAEAITHGRGKVKVGDSVWLVSGEDLPAGEMVEVTGVDGTLLLVRGAK
ncbi:MAG: NfeD family protein [Gallionellaceae bacterium]|jgi:membrane protein implicated in regulation of membrane protease activity|nr:NfeD family protein [Gallionellaceae bacterium]